MNDQQNQRSILPPHMQARFQAYPGNGRTLEPLLRHKGRCRDGYGLELYQYVGCQEAFATCAYCGLNFIESPYHWYLLSVDHIIPKNAVGHFKLEERYIHAVANQVLACKACNEYKNRDDLRNIENYTAPAIWTAEEFFLLRDRAFVYRYNQLIDSRNKELEQVYVQKWKGKGYILPDRV